MEINNSYLMWIGSDHYKTIDSWIKEAQEMGVSKRLPNDFVASALLQPGTVVFVAHDEGEMDPCPVCASDMECPDCRKHTEAAAREQALADRLGVEAMTKEGKEEASALLRQRNAAKRVEEHRAAAESCEACFGTGRITEGTGGKVVFEDGEAWDFRKYMYWRNQPKKWTAEDKGGISELGRCENCGGFGRIPCGKVFGLFVPEAIEYIDDGDAEKSKKMEEKGFKVVTKDILVDEHKRGCGKRKPGGVYAVTKVVSTSTAGADAVKALKLDAKDVEVKGNFVSLLKPIDISGTRRFRGVARWELTEETADAAAMAVEGLE